MSEFLRITTSAGVRTYIPLNYVTSITTAADAVSAVSANASGRITRGLITAVKYLDGAAAAAPTITAVAAIPEWTGANTLYEVGCQGPDGNFITELSNRSVNF